ncbi:SHOCT domain-containing protein [Actinomadura sp. CNU-125]|uniref:SHOCT domain-containing protein n=1 Tax=Actinomadura sp. CNU-125 TaxID=1904961 RepID=UPI0011780BCC|nr:SHOCT domain-containing protein [Actinomadura sp. CNU-125]
MTMWTTLATQMHPGGWGGDAPAFWPVFPVMFGLFWLAVLATGFYFIRRRVTKGGPLFGSGASHGGGDPLNQARTILAERFARGEIDEDEYLMRTSALRTDT